MFAIKIIPKCYFPTDGELKEAKQRKVWVKDLFQERGNKGAFHQRLQNIRVSDREAHFRYMITQT